MAYLDSERTQNHEKIQQTDIKPSKIQNEDGFGFHGPLGHCKWIENAPPSNTDPKMLKIYQRHVKKPYPSSASTWRTTN